MSNTIRLSPKQIGRLAKHCKRVCQKFPPLSNEEKREPGVETTRAPWETSLRHRINRDKRFRPLSFDEWDKTLDFNRMLDQFMDYYNVNKKSE